MHPGLNAYSPLGNHYPLLVGNLASGQGTSAQLHNEDIGGDALPKDPSLSDDWQRGKAEFLSIFPNVMMGVHADHIWTVYLLPNAHNETCERMDISYFQDGASDPAYETQRMKNRDRMLQIFEEDRAMVEGMQRGRLSSNFSGGALSPEMDQPAHRFNRIAADAIVRALDAAATSR